MTLFFCTYAKWGKTLNDADNLRPIRVRFNMCLQKTTRSGLIASSDAGLRLPGIETPAAIRKFFRARRAVGEKPSTDRVCALLVCADGNANRFPASAGFFAQSRRRAAATKALRVTV
jgi:hypothetical protein